MQDLTPILSCRMMLDNLNKAVQHRQWEQATQIAKDYSQQLLQMDAIEHSPAVMAELVQLDIYHRRMMRLLACKMEAVSEDIQCLESGQKSAQRALKMAKVIL